MRGGGAPPFPGPPPPRSPGGLQPCFSVSEAGNGGDGVPYTPPYRGRTEWGEGGGRPGLPRCEAAATLSLSFF